MKKFLCLLLALGLVGAAGSQAFAEKIVIEGSTTVLPIAQKAAELFMDRDAGADITVRGGGSGVGIASLIDGTCDIAKASRAMKSSELEKAASNGRDPKAHVVAMDGIAVIVHPSNRIRALSKNQVKEIYTGKISNWSQVGGGDGKIVVISRDTSSGTYEAFGELALDKAKVRPDALLQASNQAVASIVARTPGAIGYIGLGFITASVQALEIDGVQATKENVLNNTYPVSRPLFMYTNGAPKGLVKKFMDFVLSAEGQEIADEQGYVGLK